MYNTHFICTYKLHDDEDIQDDMYRIDFLNAFQLKHYNGDHILKSLEHIYQICSKNDDFISIIKNHPYYIEDKGHSNYDYVMQSLFCFETFDIFHRCITHLLNDTCIEQKDKELLFDFYNKYNKK